MKTITFRNALAACAVNSAVAMLSTAGAATPDATLDRQPALHVQAAEPLAAPEHTQILSATRAGLRIVAVGDFGVIVLSDDDGTSFRQARSVGSRSTLTSVMFVDPKTGWAVGHWGAILKTVDGGENWALQRSDIKTDRPLFSVYIKNSSEGFAVGLWSLLLHTSDGGHTWTQVKLPPPPGSTKADTNLYRIFATASGTLFIAAEQGRVLRSTDGGMSWTYLDTGYTGSFWSGVATRDGAVIVAGLRGTIYRSTDDGDHWQRAKTPLEGSITDIAQLANGDVVAAGLDGDEYTSHDGGTTFEGRQRFDRAALTALAVSGNAKPIWFSKDGVVR
ncbi:Ycf48-like protein [Paraburkholderia domus]|uniref:WD40/YVTN/BNR-like repeat-containing protein n=1 Tax=Paraburkholderia domus TaxID=2793075 RepID=UPI001B2F5F59|nr:YCF48-related protein [Paraburkholderia domus]MBK5050485.1 glycosyl hydrolase [Burkholderia sp. R-70006]CAE6754059.1 Ycf48-like protein [Paraburkholderia domus]